MIVFTKQQFDGAVMGHTLAIQIADLFSGFGVLFPVLVVLYIYALFWWSVRYSQGKEKISTLILYLFVSTLLISMSTYLRSPFKIELYPLMVSNENGKYLCYVEKDGKKAVDYACDEPFQKPVFELSSEDLLKKKEVPDIVTLYSLFDYPLGAIWNAVLTLDKIDGVDNTPVEKGSCYDPSYIFWEALDLTFTGLLKDASKRGELHKCHVDIMHKMFKEISEVKNGEDFWRKMSEGIGGWEGFVKKVTGYTVQTAEAFFGFLPKDCNHLLRTNFTFNLLALSYKQVLDTCQKEEGWTLEERTKAENQLRAYAIKEGWKKLKEWNELLSFLETVKERTDLMREEIGKPAAYGGGIIQKLQGLVTWIAKYKNENMNLGLVTKLAVFWTGQGFLLGLIIGLTPLVALLSLIPAGDNMMNLRLLITWFLGYFLVQLWIPLLHLLYVFLWGRAVHKFLF